MRASDADRHATVRILQDGIARGLLTPTEGSDRMAAAFAAVYERDLGPLTSDLPGSSGNDQPRGWHPLLLMVLDQLQFSLRIALTGRRRPAQLGAALLIAALLVICGSALAHLVLDNGGGRGHGGFGHR